jgi:hypothetical protein
MASVVVWVAFPRVVGMLYEESILVRVKSPGPLPNTAVPSLLVIVPLSPPDPPLAIISCHSAIATGVDAHREKHYPPPLSPPLK